MNRWLWLGLAFVGLLALEDARTWGHPELELVNVFDVSGPDRAIIWVIVMGVALVWARLAIGRKPAGYRTLIPDWLTLAGVLAFVALIAWALADGGLY